MRRGFSLVELVIVLAILAIGAGIAVMQVTRSRSRQEVSRTVIDVSAVLMRARAIARVAGPRIGTAQLIAGAGCATGPLDVTVNPGAGTITYPAQIQPGAAGAVTTTCDVFTLPAGSGPPIEMTLPQGNAIFSFTALGRLAGGMPVSIQFEEPYSGLLQGVLVLPSGLLCESSSATGAVACNEEP